MEIERKWFLPNTPYATNIKGLAEVPIKSYQVEQFYTSYEPEVRFGRGRDYSRGILYNRVTIKSNGGLSRIEEICDISSSVLDAASSLIPWKNKIYKEYKKTCLKFQGHDLFLEVSCVDNTFTYAEIEFPDEVTAMQFKAPSSWAECTYFRCFKMKSYARNKKLYLVRRAMFLFFFNFHPVTRAIFGRKR